VLAMIERPDKLKLELRHFIRCHTGSSLQDSKGG
jgi:hypothetical protein